MDFIFHGATNIALQKTIQKEKPKKKWRFILEMFLWGALPDLIPFTVPVIISLVQGIAFWVGERPELLELSYSMYQFTHSLVIWSLLFVLIKVVFKKWYLPLLGWPIHILMDMPLHAPDYFATPFLFPLSSWTLPFGISWATWWIWGSLWILLIFWFILLRRKNKKQD